MVLVIKRDGREEDFNKNKIENAIKKAWSVVYDNHETGNIVSSYIAENIEESINEEDFVSVEVIHEKVIQYLTMDEPEVGVCYARYYTERKTKYEMEMDLTSRINRLISGDKELNNENANKDSRTFSTKRDLMAGQIAKVEGLKILPQKVRDAHLRGDIHFHDLDYSPYLPYSNCCLVDIKFMFENGFSMGNAEIENPKSIQTASAQIAQIIASVASAQFGGTSIDRIDELLAPYAEMNYYKHFHMLEGWMDSDSEAEVLAWEMTKKDIYDACQSLEYEVNTLYTANGQTPFVTFGFGMGTNRYERSIQKSILNVRLKGLGKSGITAIFPKLIFGIKDGINHKPKDPNYDIKQLALKCASERMYPDIINYDTIVRLTGSYKASMGCRSFLQGWKDENGKEVNSGRMNLGVVTLNLPRIAIQSNGNKKLFWKIFEERMDIIHQALNTRLKSVLSVLPENAPILYKHGAFGTRLKDGEDPSKLFLNKRSTISIGYIGLYEVGSLLFGSEWESNKEAKEFTLSILKRMKELSLKWSDEEDVWYSVYGTPSESLTDRFCQLDKEKFGVIANVTDKDYYTNSFHYDIRKKPTPFEKLDFEKDYPVYASGGFIHYVEYPNIKHNLKALETVWDYSYDKIGYLGTNTPIDKCFECGFAGEFNPTERGFECPTCKNSNPETCDVVKRTCGYLGNPQARPMVHGRHKEISARKKHM